MSYDNERTAGQPKECENDCRFVTRIEVFLQIRTFGPPFGTIPCRDPATGRIYTKVGLDFNSVLLIMDKLISGRHPFMRIWLQTHPIGLEARPINYSECLWSSAEIARDM